MLRLLLFISFFTAGAFECLAQAATPDTSSGSVGVVIYADARLSLVTASRSSGSNTNSSRTGSGSSRSGSRGGSIRSARGFRVQIYSGNDRAQAMRIKADFIRRFPGTRSYVTYIAPTFRIKVGDFKSRADAASFARQLGGLYTPTMIVPDIVVINTFRDGQ